jgi:hypothetical protein
MWSGSSCRQQQKWLGVEHLGLELARGWWLLLLGLSLLLLLAVLLQRKHRSIQPRGLDFQWAQVQQQGGGGEMLGFQVLEGALVAFLCLDHQLHHLL